MVSEKEMLNSSKWNLSLSHICIRFSFRQTRNGRITEVFYKDEETRIVALKKAIVGSFSANLLSKVTGS